MFRILFFSSAVLLTAGAAGAQDVRIRYGDLDLATAAGATALDQRVTRAARAYCAGQITLEKTRCQGRVRAEALRALPDDARADYARGSRSFDV